MYILCLRRIAEPSAPPMGVAHSDSEQKLLDYMTKHSSAPAFVEIDGVKTFRVFAPGSGLEDFMPPTPGSEDEGIKKLDSIEDTVNLILEASRPQVLESVQQAREKMKQNTIPVL